MKRKAPILIMNARVICQSIRSSEGPFSFLNIPLGIPDKSSQVKKAKLIDNIAIAPT